MAKNHRGKMRRLVTLCCAASLALTIGGCGSQNDAAPSINALGQHPSRSVWYFEHRAAYSRYPQQCTQCHGTDLRGGISGVNCFTGIAGIPGFACHANGHPPAAAPHPVPFKAAALHGPAAKADLVNCQGCHATAGGPGSNPRFNVAIGSLVNGCEDCHAARTAHPPVDPAKVPGFSSQWPGHATAGNLANACVLCHGTTLSGPKEGGVGPACNSCHTTLQPGTLPVAGACVSCHEKPPANGSHLVHNALAGVTNACGTCHNGAGSGTSQHDNGTVEVAIAPGYIAASGGSATFTAARTCSNVRCHGGVTTPVWGGQINVAADCAACHVPGSAAQTPQFNSYFSGRHSLHLNQIGLACTDCHDMSVVSGGASHFSGLATPAFELAPRLTIRVPGYAATPGSCTPTTRPPAGTYSVGVCHGTERWQ